MDNHFDTGTGSSRQTTWTLTLSLCLVSVLFVSSGCGGRRKPARPPAPVPPSQVPGEWPARQELEGLASFYGDPHHGRPTANGEIFDKHAMTAAHRTLPFNTRVRVHNLESGQSVVVRINDRGPFIAGRIIDLSEEAGRRLGIFNAGIARVRLEILSMPTERAGVGYGVQVGAFAERQNAENLRKKLSQRYGHVTVVRFDSGTTLFYRVRVGAEPSLARANELANQLRREDLETFIVRLDGNPQ